jgi:Ca-activated chloride channel homolog
VAPEVERLRVYFGLMAELGWGEHVRFDPTIVRSWRLIGYENRLISAEDFRDDAVPGSYIGAGHEVTAIYELDLQVEGGDAAGDLGAVHVRWADPDRGEVSEIDAALDASLATDDATSTSWAAAAGMTALVEALRGSQHVLVNLEQTAQQLEEAGGEQDRWLAGMVRDAADAFQGASPQRRQATTP